MVERTSLLKKLFDEKTVIVLSELLNNPGIFYLRDISKSTKVSLATTYRIIQKLLNIGLVERKKVGKLTQYIVKKGEKYNETYALLYGKKIDPLFIFKQKLKSKYLHNFSIFKTENNKIFVITNKIIDIYPTKKEIENQNNIKLDILTLDEKQFKQMRDMELIKKGTYI